MSKDKAEELKSLAVNMRKDALFMAYSAGNHAAHFGAGMSIIEILAVLYGNIMKLDRNDPKWEGRDRFILSKGHGVIGYYAALSQCGYIPKEDLECFEQKGSYLLGHPVQDIEHGIEFTNGSLGMGLSIGVGVALDQKRKGKDSRTYVLVGDGECGEGAVWEAAMSAAHFQLNNLCVIVDRNRFQLGGYTCDIMNSDDLALKFKVFGWDVDEVDGHDVEMLIKVFQKARNSSKPFAVIADTVKGKGFSFSENNNAWHHATLTQKQYESALSELGETS